MGAADKLNSQQIAERLDELPTLPAIVYELSRVIGDPMASTSDVEKVMANDQSLTTKVLRLANSAYYAIPGGVSTLQRAIGYIGYDTIHQLVLSASIIQALDVKKSVGFDLNQFWKHSVGVAMASETIARYVHYKSPADLFTCGLVHDMGKVAVFIITPDAFFEAVDFARENKVSFADAEEALGSAKHSFVGQQLAARWRLPAQLQAVIAHHHQGDAGLRSGLSSEMNLVVDIVYLSNLLMHALRFGNSGHQKVLGVPREILERLQLDSEKLETLIAKIRESIANAEVFLKIIGG